MPLEKSQTFTAQRLSVFGLNLVRIFRIWTEYGALRIQYECGKIRTRITPNKDTFYAVFETLYSPLDLTYSTHFFGLLTCTNQKLLTFIKQTFETLFSTDKPSNLSLGRKQSFIKISLPGLQTRTKIIIWQITKI